MLQNTKASKNTFGLRNDYIWGAGIANSVSCTMEAATDLSISSTVLPLTTLANQEDAEELRNLYLSIYVPPGLDGDDYVYLQVLSEAPSE